MLWKHCKRFQWHIALLKCLQSLPMLACFIEGKEDMKDGARVGRSSTVKCAIFTVVVQNLWEGSCAQGLFLTH